MSLLTLELITATLVLATAIIGVVVRKKIQEVHVLVNDRMTEALGRIDQLVAALGDAGVDVPPRHDSEVGEREQ